ncbi:MAG: NAD(P)-dependent alcohol dehydrogenase [Acetivibrionales bacterium]|jgi:L-iditol 2-dehydrogenase
MENKAVWLLGKQNIKIDTAPMPVPKPDEVVIKVGYVGICGSDMHFYETGNYSKGPIVDPLILGHECAGTVVAAGEDVKNLAVGDNVAVEPGETCGQCEYCLGGRYNLCKSVRFKSVPPFHGVMRNYVAHSAERCFKLPDNVSLLEGALIEPFAIGLYAVERAEVKKGDTVVILGTGCIGMMTLLAAKAMGAGKIIAVDLYDSRLEKAKSLGADEIINSAKEDCAERVMEITDGAGADVVFEAAGSKATLTMAPGLCKSGGIIMMVGNIYDPVTFNFWSINHREIEIRSIYRYCNTFPKAISMVASKEVNLLPLVTDTYDFGDAEEAFKSSILNKVDTLKCVIKINSDLQEESDESQA